MTTAQADNHWYSPARNFRTSARLHLQHYLFQNTVGYLLEPTVEKGLSSSTRAPRIADIGCGNGVWLTELHSHFAKNNISAQLDGFDINTINFPDAAHLPGTIRLRKLDVLANPMPVELIGIYDVVHIRAFVSILGSDPTPAVAVASKLLKPGGYLQWEESRASDFIVESPSQAPKTACDTISNILKSSQAARGVNYDWVDSLDTHLDKLGFQNITLLRHEKRKQDLKAWTEDYLLVWEELAVYLPPKAEVPDAPLSRDTWIDLFANAVKETERGVVVHQNAIVTCIGKKAT
ncbi:hypothetical protein NQ176_g3065 [Zarea fungicola]|uniref:Uncharacterized protein n=1 Tax=Zarea fungicola TaxID=93591 RepID=A0ACC1NLF9_9HYPO|nr:hypothetical protein NQ176_g3065 [Lecanicillium fungicola]